MFGKRKISDEEAGDVLTDDTFSSSEPLFNQVQKEELIEVTLDQIVKSPLNPRQIKNPKFDEIKESIRNRGLDQPPKLTKREPGQEKWEIADGGNSRVDILRELYNECKEQSQASKEIAQKIELDQQAQKFFRFKARVVPWGGEINALSGHVVENEVHSPMLFIEKALAAKQLKEMFEIKLRDPKQFEKYQKLGFKKPLTAEQSLGTRPLARLITHYGWVVNAGNLTRYQYAAETLVNLIPDALWAGAGHDVVARIKKLGSAYLAFIKEQLEDKETATDLFDTCWAEALRQNDDENIHSKWADVRKEMEGSISNQLDVDREYLSKEIDRILQGKAASSKAAELIISTQDTAVDQVENKNSNENYNASRTEDVNKSQEIVTELAVNSMEEVINSTMPESDSGSNEERINDREPESKYSSLSKIIHGLHLSISNLAEEAGISALIKVTEEKTNIFTKVQAPKKHFIKDSHTSFIWLKMLCLFEKDLKQFSKLLYKAFGEKISLEKLLMQSQSILLEDPACRKCIKLFRKVEDQVFMLMDEKQVEQGGA